jgi:hypothetical protein
VVAFEKHNHKGRGVPQRTTTEEFISAGKYSRRAGFLTTEPFGMIGRSSIELINPATEKDMH